MATTIPEAVTTIPAGTLRLLLDLISYRAKARKELRRKPPIVPRRPPRSCCWTAPPGLHGLRSAAPSYMPYYNRSAALACIASLRGGGIWYALEALRRCDTLQRGAGGVIVDCIGLVYAVVECGKSQEKRL